MKQTSPHEDQHLGCARTRVECLVRTNAPVFLRIQDLRKAETPKQEKTKKRIGHLGSCMGFTCVELQLPVRNNIVSRGFSLQILPIEAKNYSRPMRNKLVHSASYRRAKERNSKSHPRLGILHSELIRRVVDPPNGASCGRQLKTQILRQRSLGTKIQSPMIQRFANTSTKDLA